MVVAGEQSRRVGLFVDADNVLPYWRSVSVLEQHINDYLKLSDYKRVFAEIERRAAQQGEVLLREAYGKWDNKARVIAASLMHHEFGYSLQHVPPLSRRGRDQSASLKNAGDILLASRAILSAATGPEDLDTVIIVAADTDYHPLVAELKRLGKRVICISFPLFGQQQTLLAAVFDQHITIPAVSAWVTLKDHQTNPPEPEATRPSEPARPVEPAAAPGMAAPHAIAQELWSGLVAPGTKWPPLARRLLSATNISVTDSQTVISRLPALGLVTFDGGIWKRTEETDAQEWLGLVADAIVKHFVVRAMRSSRELDATPGEQVAAMRVTALACFESPDDATVELVDMHVARRAASLGAPGHLTD
ncbi:MAG: NYN domain-containing protein [Actinomycetota bacterium]